MMIQNPSETVQIILASQSPRRRDLLESLGFSFRTIRIDCDEIYPNEIPVSEIAAYLSQLKAQAYFGLKEKEILITADTIVAVGDFVLGKPKNEEEAIEMLKKLSGKIHQVYTAVTIKTFEKTITKTDVAQVEFSEFTEPEIQYYVEHFYPLDKAGSYGIQEWLGMAKMKSIKGSFYTIMGLPTHIVYEELKKIIP